MTKFYCDGSFRENKIYWACIKVENDKIISEFSNDGAFSGKADVERAESAAILHACTSARIEVNGTKKGNFVIYTDSQSVIDKVRKNVPNATKNSDIAGIRNILEFFRQSPLPISLEIKHLKRCSNEFMRFVDNKCKGEVL